jgi:hypothetical protein
VQLRASDLDMKGETGIADVDAWVKVTNPGNVRGRVKIASPDYPRRSIRPDL